MKYNIYFSLGDPWNDGHGYYSSYRITANYSVKDIENAYMKTTEILGFNFIKEVGSEYECSRWIPEEYTNKLLSLGIINKENIVKEDSEFSWDTPKGCFEFSNSEDEFIEIYFNIVKYSLPDFEWETRDLEEETLSDLNGAAYRLVY